MLELRGRVYQILQSIGLLLVCVACYVLLILLYLQPKIYHLESLINPDHNSIKPTVVVGLLAAVLAASTCALVSRCVEQSLWIDLNTERDESIPESALTVGEARRLAQWSSSPLYRLLYLFGGFSGEDKRSWLLRIAGPLLVATAMVGPVLLAGISVSELRTVTVESTPRAADAWASHLDAGNDAYRGGNSYDTPTVISALAAMRNLSAPAAPLCEAIDTRSTCSVSARSVAILANCRAATRPNPDGVGTIASGKNSTVQFCTGLGTPRKLCVDLVSSSPATYAAFSSGPPPCQGKDDCPSAGVNGSWGVIFGAWVNGVDLNDHSQHRINTVACVLRYGNITITQNGTSPPYLERDTFAKSASKNGYEYGYTKFNIFQLNRIYSELRTSPYDWSAAAAGTGSNTAYSNPMAFSLLGTNANNDAESVARQIEANFDMATLHAFARGPNSSELVYTRETTSPVYEYRPKMLLVLLVPLLATILGSWARWSVADEIITVGYDPVGIARLGPVSGLVTGPPPEDREARETEDGLKVWRWRRTFINPDQSIRTLSGLQVASSGMEPFMSEQPPSYQVQSRL